MRIVETDREAQRDRHSQAIQHPGDGIIGDENRDRIGRSDGRRNRSGWKERRGVLGRLPDGSPGGTTLIPEVVFPGIKSAIP